MQERESYREIILENIDYDILTQDEKLDRDHLDELVELMVDTVGISLWIKTAPSPIRGMSGILAAASMSFTTASAAASPTSTG